MPDAFANDLAKATLSDEAQKRERSLFVNVLTQAPAFMAALRGPTHIFDLTNRAYDQLIGHRSVIGQPVASALPEVVAQGVVQILDQVFQSGKAYVAKDANVRLQINPDGPLSEVVVDFTYQPLFGDDGTVSGILVHGVDRTQRKQQERELKVTLDALRASEENLREAHLRLEAALSAGEIAICTIDVKARRVFGDATLARFFSRSPEDVAGGAFTLFLNAICEMDRARAIQAVQEALKNADVYEDEYRVAALDDDAAPRWLYARAKIERDPNGVPLKMLGVVVDITERKMLEQEREQLLEQEKARAEQERLFSQINLAVRTVEEPEVILQNAVTLLGQGLQADRCYIVRSNIERDTARVAPEWLRAEANLASFAGRIFSISAYSINRNSVYRAGRTHVINDVRLEGEEDAAPILAMHLCALVRVPVESGAVGTSLTVAMAHDSRDWTQDEVRLVENVAALLRVTLETARVQQRERNIAQQLQVALQPLAPDNLLGLALDGFYRPALAEAGVGGDFYDVFALEKGCSALVVGDLSGKGLAAASEVATVRNMVRYALYSHSSVASAVAGVNQVLVERHLLRGFSTLFVGVYDAAARSLTYVNCGQEPGLIWRKANAEVEYLPPTGGVLGGFESDEKYEEETVFLASGDVLALFTDGVTEVGPSRKEQLEIGGVSALLRDGCADAVQARNPKTISNFLIAHVDAFARDGVRDDIALLVGVAE